MDTTKNIPKHIWKKEHVEVLDKVFPELFNDTDVNKILLNQGKRAVIHWIHNQFKQQAHRVDASQPKQVVHNR